MLLRFIIDSSKDGLVLRKDFMIPDILLLYVRNKRTFLSNSRYKSSGRVKTKPTFNQLIKDTHNQLIEKWGPYMEVNDPSLYESMTGKKARKAVIEVSDSK